MRVVADFRAVSLPINGEVAVARDRDRVVGASVASRTLVLVIGLLGVTSGVLGGLRRRVNTIPARVASWADRASKSVVGGEVVAHGASLRQRCVLVALHVAASHARGGHRVVASLGAGRVVATSDVVADSDAGAVALATFGVLHGVATRVCCCSALVVLLTCGIGHVTRAGLVSTSWNWWHCYRASPTNIVAIGSSITATTIR